MADPQTGTLKKNLYLTRYAYAEKLVETCPHPQLDLVVTIPCYNEPNLIDSLKALHQCDRKNLYIEVIVVINEGTNASLSVSQQNAATFCEAVQWANHHSSPQLSFHVLYKNDLPPKHAGVGLARKIAMDEAVRRFEFLNRPDGVIVCFDADSSCDHNYLQAIYRFFLNHPESPGCSIYFEHPLAGDHKPEIYEAIIDYELFLRYYVNALRYAGFPYAFETIGSSMAVRSEAYQKQGGMNRRKAGEDFYFLHKIIPMGNFGEVNETRVIPSPRGSDRVPFGTGKAVNDWLEHRIMLTYDPAIFEDLKIFFGGIDQLYNINGDRLTPWVEQLPLSISQFLLANDFKRQLTRINKHSASPATFIKQFYHWFDGFKVLKCVHSARDKCYPNIPVAEAASQLLRMLNPPSDVHNSRDLLQAYRVIDRTFQ